jgi:hypothetical protein
MIAQLSKDYIKIGGFKKVLQRILSYFIEGRPLTTKGRFINVLMAPLISFLIFLKVKKPVKTYFIVGQGRSGSTYLGMLLSLNMDYFFLNEPKLPWSLVNATDDLVGSYTKKGSYSFDKIDNQVQKRISSFYSCMSFFTGSKVILDKYPEMIFRRSWILKNLPASKFLILYRDYNSIVASIPSWNDKHSSSSSSWWGKNNRKWNLIKNELIPKSKIIKGHYFQIENLNDYEKSLVEWLLTVEQNIELIKSSQDNFYIFNYEELEISLDIFIMKETVCLNDFSKVREYFKRTHRQKNYNELAHLNNCNKELIDLSNKVEGYFKDVWHNYKSLNIHS